MTRQLISVLAFAVLWHSPQPAGEYPIQALPLTSVTITDGFWKPRLDRIRSTTLPHLLDQNETTGRLDNFLKAAKKKPGEFAGVLHADAIVYQTVEVASYALAAQRDPVLDKKTDELIAIVAAAQQPDGYLYTPRGVNPTNVPPGAGADRFSSLATSYELYNLGSLIEAAVAHNLATGKRNLLDVAVKAANLVTNVFGPEKRRDVAGHPGIELALLRLARLTGENKFLRTAKFLLDARSNKQDVAAPLAAMTDVAVYAEDRAAPKLLDAKFDDLTSKRPLTGDLDPCTTVDSIFWYQRMFLRSADVKYLDMLERTLLNEYLAGVSEPADKVSCLANLARVMAQVPTFMYAQSKNELFVTQFSSNTAKFTVEGLPLTITQSTEYPWQGRVQLRLDPAKPLETMLSIRVPGWLRGETMPGDVYRFASPGGQSGLVMLNGRSFDAVETDGFLQIHRTWRAGDTLVIEFPMPVQRVLAHDTLAEHKGQAAIQRGPIVYAVETAKGVKAPLASKLTVAFDKTLADGVMVVRGPGLMAVPYFAVKQPDGGKPVVWLPYQ